MHVLGIYAGRKGQLSGFWLQNALKGAEEAGATVSMVNLRDLDIKPCTGCCVCHHGRFESGKGSCVFQDDMPWLDEQILSCDGMIVCAPCYEKTPPSEIKLFMDRLGPSHDVTHLRHADQQLKAAGKEGYDPRWFKQRPCAFISHGGSEWGTLGVPTLSIIAVPLGMTIVDLLSYPFNSDCVLQDAKIQRVQQLGRAVAENCGLPTEQMTYRGDPAFCPMCHNSTMVLEPGTTKAVCAVCGMEGEVSVENGAVQIHFPPEEFQRSHVTESGRHIHLLDMNMKGREEMIRPKLRKEEVQARIKAGTGWYQPIKPEKG